MLEVQTMLVVEDLAESRAFLATELQAVFPNCRVLVASDLKDARAHLQKTPRMRLALVDLGLPDGSGADLIREMQTSHPETQVIVTTVYSDDENLFGALAAGAQGYLIKSDDLAVFRLHLKNLAAGLVPLSPTVARRLLQYFRERADRLVPEELPFVPLSPRETEVLAYIGRGLRVAETARLLGLAESTVAGYVKSLYQKLNISSRAEAALEAVKRGLH